MTGTGKVEVPAKQEPDEVEIEMEKLAQQWEEEAREAAQAKVQQVPMPKRPRTKARRKLRPLETPPPSPPPDEVADSVRAKRRRRRLPAGRRLFRPFWTGERRFLTGR